MLTIIPDKGSASFKYPHLNIPTKREEGRQSRPSSLFVGILFFLQVPNDTDQGAHKWGNCADFAGALRLQNQRVE
jgi:hypothetical protein